MALICHLQHDKYETAQRPVFSTACFGKAQYYPTPYSGCSCSLPSSFSDLSSSYQQYTYPPEDSQPIDFEKIAPYLDKVYL